LPIGNINLFPASYFKDYPYGGVLTFGKESLHKFVITEVEVYSGIFKPYVFYNWGESDVLSAETFLKYSVNATVLSYGFDLTVTDRSKDNFRVSATIGRSRFIDGVDGASPWERRYALSLLTPYLSIVFADGIPTYGWYYQCFEWKGSTCVKAKVVYTFNRSAPTLLVGGGKIWKYRGLTFKVGLGNFLFFFNRLISTTKVDPTAVYLVYPAAYFYVSKRW
jgi:hypothetical protein